MTDPEREALERNVRRAVGISALHKIGRIVATEELNDAREASALRWFLRYGWAVFLTGALVLAYLLGVI